MLAVGSQVLGSRLRVPALIILLPAGFIAGAITGDVNPHKLLGPAFRPLVSLSVAVILYNAGLGLDWKKRIRKRHVVHRLILLGVPITWAFAGVFAGLLLGLSTGAAVMIGVILVVSGPTVVDPLMRGDEDAYSTGREEADALIPGEVRAGDVVVLHDPIAAALAPAIRQRGAHAAWQASIGNWEGPRDALVSRTRLRTVMWEPAPPRRAHAAGGSCASEPCGQPTGARLDPSRSAACE